MATKKQATKSTKNEQPKSESTLYSVYGARISKSGNRVNVSLVKGKDEDKEWACVSIKIDGDGKIKAKIKDGFAFIKIPMLEADEDRLDY